jgi:hypothetical protein
MNIYESLNAARIKFLVANPKKTGKNKFNNFMYYELSDILPTALPIMKEFGLCPVISFDDAGICTMTVHMSNSQETLKITSPFAVAELKGGNPLQNLGGAHTYLRRYMWLLLLEITEADEINASMGGENDAYNDKKTTQQKAVNNKSVQDNLQSHINSNEVKKNKLSPDDMKQKIISCEVIEDLLIIAKAITNDKTLSEAEKDELSILYKSKKRDIETSI